MIMIMAVITMMENNDMVILYMFIMRILQRTDGDLKI